MREPPRYNGGVVTAIVLPFRVAENTTMEKQRAHTTKYHEAPGINVLKLREERGWSLRELGHRCKPELDHTTIRRVEQNGGWTRDTIERVAHALGLKQYQDLFLPPELFAYSFLGPEAREKVASMIQDTSDAEQYRKRQIK